jgi:hypothetical protein
MRLVAFKDKAGDWVVLEDVCPHRWARRGGPGGGGAAGGLASGMRQRHAHRPCCWACIVEAPHAPARAAPPRPEPQRRCSAAPAPAAGCGDGLPPPRAQGSAPRRSRRPPPPPPAALGRLASHPCTGRLAPLSDGRLTEEGEVMCSYHGERVPSGCLGGHCWPPSHQSSPPAKFPPACFAAQRARRRCFAPPSLLAPQFLWADERLHLQPPA